MSSTLDQNHKITGTALTTPDWIGLVRAKVESLRYGVVQIIVHDGKVTQIEHTEKTRIVAPREY